MYKNLLFSFITCILIFVLLFTADRLLWLSHKSSKITRNDAQLSFTLNPAFKSEKVRINKYYARGKDFDLTKLPEKTRIIALGDSCTFGWGVPDAETYPIYLENLLNNNSSNNPYEVINFGTPGYSSLELIHMLEDHVVTFQPDKILLMIGWNDVQSKGLIPYSLRKNRFFFALNSLINKSVLVTSIKEAIVKIKSSKAKQALTESRESLIKETVFYIDEKTASTVKNAVYVPLDDFKENLSEMISFCKKKNVRLYILVPPCGFLPNDFLNGNLNNIPAHQWQNAVAGLLEMYKQVLAFDRYAQELRIIAGEHNIPLIDIYAAYSSLPLGKRLAYFDNTVKDWIHPNASGNEAMAEIIYKTLHTDTQ